MPPQFAALVGITHDPYPQALFDTANSRMAFGKLECVATALVDLTGGDTRV